VHNLSIVFQGPADVRCSTLYLYLQRTRNTFPDAEIIVSTWHSTPTTDALLNARLARMGVRLILSNDPGPLTGHDISGRWTTNLNRLLCSARAGLQAASRPLVIKLRTDTWLSSRALLDRIEQDVLRDAGPPRQEAFKVFSHRVINASWFARDPKGSLPFLFHPGDILLAGKTEDVRLFFSAPQADTSLFCPARMPGLWSAWRYVRNNGSGYTPSVRLQAGWSMKVILPIRQPWLRRQSSFILPTSSLMIIELDTPCST
jgi:hypothetical protein